MLLALEGATMRAWGQQSAVTPPVGAPERAAPDRAPERARGVRAPQTSPPAVDATSAGGVIRGSVMAGATPLPGVAVTAANSLTGKRYTTTTDITGAFAMRIPANGRYVVRTELAAFAGETREVVVNGAGENGGKPEQVVAIGMELASRAAAQQQVAEAKQQATQAATLSRAIGGSGVLQSLSLQASGVAGAADATAGGGNQGAQLPSIAGMGDAESVAITGQAGQTNGLANLSEDDVRERVQDALAQARRNGGSQGDLAGAVMGVLGGFMGPGGGGFGGGRGGGLAGVAAAAVADGAVSATLIRPSPTETSSTREEMARSMPRPTR